MRVSLPFFKSAWLEIPSLAGFSLVLGLSLATSNACACLQDEKDDSTAESQEAEMESEESGIRIDKKDSPPVARFSPPQLLKAEGEIISVESPGYACPTMADVDGDGKIDLVVGQFRSGNMKFFKNVAASDQLPRFAAGQWLMTDDKKLVVPGVW